MWYIDGSKLSSAVFRLIGSVCFILCIPIRIYNMIFVVGFVDSHHSFCSTQKYF